MTNGIMTIPTYHEADTEHLSVRLNLLEDSVGKPVNEYEVWVLVHKALLNTLHNSKKMHGYKLVMNSVYYWCDGDWAVGGMIIKPIK